MLTLFLQYWKAQETRKIFSMTLTQNFWFYIFYNFFKGSGHKTHKSVTLFHALHICQQAISNYFLWNITTLNLFMYEVEKFKYCTCKNWVSRHFSALFLYSGWFCNIYGGVSSFHLFITLKVPTYRLYRT